MSFGTVFPEMAMGFAETVMRALEAADEREWAAEDLQQIALTLREVRQKYASMEQGLRNTLVEGVDVATFVRRWDPLLTRLDKLLAQDAAILADAGRFPSLPSEDKAMFVEFEAMQKAVALFRDLLKEALSTMKAPRCPIDWQRVHDAQAAHLRGETKPLEAAPATNGD